MKTCIVFLFEFDARFYFMCLLCGYWCLQSLTFGQVDI